MEDGAMQVIRVSKFKQLQVQPVRCTRVFGSVINVRLKTQQHWQRAATAHDTVPVASEAL